MGCSSTTAWGFSNTCKLPEGYKSLESEASMPRNFLWQERFTGRSRRFLPPRPCFGGHRPRGLAGRRTVAEGVAEAGTSRQSARQPTPPGFLRQRPPRLPLLPFMLALALLSRVSQLGPPLARLPLLRRKFKVSCLRELWLLLPSRFSAEAPATAAPSPRTGVGHPRQRWACRLLQPPALAWTPKRWGELPSDRAHLSALLPRL